MTATRSAADLGAQANAALNRIVAASDCDELLVAFSGGRDSSVLLHVAVAFARAAGLRIRALHVDHGLHAQSGQWAAHCREAAHAAGVNCAVVGVSERPPQGSSVEAWARAQRYRALSSTLGARTCVLTAHHADDQAETVLHRVLGGAGPHGLAAMRELRAFGAVHLGRPLLHCSVAAISAYAKSHALAWVDDPGNHDRRFLRNRLRHELLPHLETCYPGAAAGLRRLAGIQSQLADSLDRRADTILAVGTTTPMELELRVLRACDAGMQAVVLRRALVRAGLSPPGERRLREILQRLCSAREDANPLVAWGGTEVRRYRERLYFMRACPAPDPGQLLAWDPGTELRLPWGVLRAVRGPAPALDAARLSSGLVRIGFRRGGERCHPVTRTHSQSLKKLFQEWGVPPWRRVTMPLLLIDGQLAAVGAECVCRGFSTPADQPGLVLEWVSSQ